MKSALSSALLALVLIVCSCSETKPLGDNSFAVSGQVLDRAAEVGIPEALLTISVRSDPPAEYYTDSLGSFTISFGGPRSLVIDFTVTKDGYSPLDTPLVLTHSVEVVWTMDKIEPE